MGRLNWKKGVVRSATGWLFLMNQSLTRVEVKRRLKFDPFPLFRDLDRAGFPFAFAEGIRTVRFTVMSQGNVGIYFDGRVWVDVSYAGFGEALETFIHEVAHHIDEQEEVSARLGEERKKRGKFLKSKHARRSDDEYLAVGFERYYSLDRKKRSLLRQQNPKLYRTIQRLHRRYSKK